MNRKALTPEEVASLVKRGLMQFPKGKVKLIIQRSPEENEKMMHRRAMDKIYRDNNREKIAAYGRKRRKNLPRKTVKPPL